MTSSSWGCQAEVRDALQAIVTRFGERALSNAQVMSNLLEDLLPDSPEEKELLGAAAQDGLAGALRELLARGMDLGTASKLTARAFGQARSHPPDACAWVVGELAVALGLRPDPSPAPAPPIVNADPVARVERSTEIRLRLSAIQALSVAWRALDKMGWRVTGNAVLPGDHHIEVTKRSALREFADHLDALHGSRPRSWLPADPAVGWPRFDPAADIMVRVTSTPGPRDTTVSAVVTVSHIGWKTPEDQQFAEQAIRDFTDGLRKTSRTPARWRRRSRA